MLLLLGGAAILLFSQRPVQAGPAQQTAHLTPVAVLVIICAFALSLLWTSGSQVEALNSLGKYGKLLMIPLIVALLRSREEARYALAAFALTQLFLLLSSWMLFLHLPVPWATSETALSHYTPFSSYLDEGIMTALFASLCWHLRALLPGRLATIGAPAVAVLALLNVLFVLEGRSGHIVAVVLLSLAIMWELPARYRAGIILLPFVLTLAVSLVSPRVQNRLIQAKQEIQAFSLEKGASTTTGSSSGIRLHFWHRAAQLMAENPVLGSGVGSWSHEYNRLDKAQNPAHQEIGPLGNPHQEYLLWGVQLGIPGIALIAGLLGAMLRDTKHMEKMPSRAAHSAIFALAIACLFNASIYDALIGDFFCVVLGLLLALGCLRPSPPSSLKFKQAASSQ